MKPLFGGHGAISRTRPFRHSGTAMSILSMESGLDEICNGVRISSSALSQPPPRFELSRTRLSCRDLTPISSMTPFSFPDYATSNNPGQLRSRFWVQISHLIREKVLRLSAAISSSCRGPQMNGLHLSNQAGPFGSQIARIVPPLKLRFLSKH